MCEDTHTLRGTVYEPIHHNICRCSWRANRIINRYPPDHDRRAVISPRGSPNSSLRLCLSHTHPSPSRPSHRRVTAQPIRLIGPDITGWDLALLCVCECGHGLSDVVIDVAVTNERPHACCITDPVTYWSTFLTRGK